jgi:hypothetical protein
MLRTTPYPSFDSSFILHPYELLRTKPVRRISAIFLADFRGFGLLIHLLPPYYSVESSVALPEIKVCPVFSV